MVTFAEGLRDTLGDAFCTLMRFNESAISTIIEYSPVPTTANPSRIPLGIARWAIRNYCNYEPPSVTDPPFEGGQCPILYTVNTIFERQSVVAFVCQWNPPETASNPFVLGPIVGLRTRPGTGGQELVIVHAGGSAETVVTFAGDSTGCPGQFRNFSITAVIPPLGVPDSCGNPIPDYPDAPEPPVPPVDIDFTYQDNDGVDVDFNAPITFAPVNIDLNGNVIIPFRLDIDPVFNIPINGTLNVNTGDIEFNFGNTNYNPRVFPQPDDFNTPDDIPDVPPSVPDDIPNPSPDVPEPDTTTVIRGVIVTVTSYDSDVTIIGQESNPDIYAPNLGFVNFGITVGNSQAWSHDIPVKNFRQIIECPWMGGATSVAGTPRVGVEWVLTPVFATAEETITFDT